MPVIHTCSFTKYSSTTESRQTMSHGTKLISYVQKYDKMSREKVKKYNSHTCGKAELKHHNCCQRTYIYAEKIKTKSKISLKHNYTNFPQKSNQQSPKHTHTISPSLCQ